MRSRDDKIRLLLALEERKRRQRSAPLSPHGTFWPTRHRKQELAIESFKANRCTLYLAGNRSGKSTVAAALIVAALYGYYIWEVENLRLTEDQDYPDRRDINPAHWLENAEGLPFGERRRIFCMTGLSMQRGISSVIFPKIMDFLPPAIRARAQINRQSGAPSELTLPNGSSVVFASGKQDAIMAEGTNYDLAVLDEPCPRSHFGGVWRGLTDSMGRLFCSLTPVGENAPFFFELFVANKNMAKMAQVVTGSIHDNLGNLGARAIHEFLEGLSGEPDEIRAAREHGSWGHLEHRAFPTFDPAAHIVRPFTIPDTWIRGMAIDPAHRRPYAVVWAAFEPEQDGRVVIYREWPNEPHMSMRSSTNTIRDYAALIRTIEGNEDIDFRCLDPRFGAQRGTLKGERFSSIQEDFADLGLYFDCQLEGTESEETGINEIRTLLRWDRNHALSPLNRPRLQIFEPCTNTISALSLRNFAPPSARDPELLPEKLLDNWKDFTDALRYVLLYHRPSVRRKYQTGGGYISQRDLEAANTGDYL